MSLLVFDESTTAQVSDDGGLVTLIELDQPRALLYEQPQFDTFVVIDQSSREARLFTIDAAASVVALDTASSTVVTMKDGEPDQLVITSGVLGPAGPAGPAGPIGPAGTAIGGSYRHVQDTPATDWLIVHNLGFNPGGATVLDSAGTLVEGDIIYNTSTTLTLHFSAPFAGTANLS